MPTPLPSSGLVVQSQLLSSLTLGVAVQSQPLSLRALGFVVQVQPFMRLEDQSLQTLGQAVLPQGLPVPVVCQLLAL